MYKRSRDFPYKENDVKHHVIISPREHAHIQSAPCLPIINIGENEYITLRVLEIEIGGKCVIFLLRCLICEYRIMKRININPDRASSVQFLCS